MQFKAIFEGVWRKEFENYKIEVKNNRGSEKKDTDLTKKSVYSKSNHRFSFGQVYSKLVM